MTLLPIVGRELRVAARKWPTYWSRVIGAGVALVLFVGILSISELTMGIGRGQVGVYLFNTLGWVSFAAVCAAGVFLTSDSLSEEKREGTLGLLFLTDLRGFDVVLGKLLASSLRGVYGLVAVFPVIGLTFLLGGMSGMEFWRLVVALCNTLFFMLAAGIFVSAISREGQRAMFATAGLCFLFLGVTWLVDWAIAGWDTARFQQVFSLVSPLNAMLQLGSTSRFGTFWTTTAWVHGFGWLFLALACALAPRTWQEKSIRTDRTGAKRRWGGSPEKRAAWRRRLFEVNPVRWLAARETWLRTVAIIAFVLVMALMGYEALRDWQAGRNLSLGISWMAKWVLWVLLVMSLASHASRFFVEATRCGALELMLASPLPAPDIVRGQWWALRRTFLLPALAVLAVKLTSDLMQLVQIWKSFRAAATTAGAGLPFTWANDYFTYQVIATNLSVISFFTGLVAVAWFGMWMGVVTRKANTAVGKTLLFVCVLPWFGRMFLQGMLMSVIAYLGAASGGGGVWPWWMAGLVSTVVGIGLDLMFFFIARRKLLGNFRETVARAAGTAVWRRPVPSALSAPPPAPPPLPA